MRGMRFSSNVQVLFRPRCDAAECLFELWHRVGNAEAKEAFAEAAKCCARERGNSGRIEQRISQRLRLPSRLLDIREDIESAFGHAARKARDVIETVDEEAAPALKLGSHEIDGILITGYRSDTGALREAGRAGIGI